MHDLIRIHESPCKSLRALWSQGRGELPPPAAAAAHPGTGLGVLALGGIAVAPPPVDAAHQYLHLQAGGLQAAGGPFGHVAVYAIVAADVEDIGRQRGQAGGLDDAAGICVFR